MATPITINAGGFGERLCNGSFEEGFAPNGVGLCWTGFDNGGSAYYHWQDDTAPAYAANGKHSQLLEVSTMQYNASEAERFNGIYQTIAVVPNTPYTLTLKGILRVLATDPDKNTWAYIVQYAIDPNGGTDWNNVKWNDIPWGNQYNTDEGGALSSFSTLVTPSTGKITLFIRALKKFPTRIRLLYVNVDGISFFGQTPGTSSNPQVNVQWPTMVYTSKPFPVTVQATDSVGMPSISLYDNDKLVASETHATGPLARQIQFAWVPPISGTHTLRVEVTNQLGGKTTITNTVPVVPIVEFMKNGDFEGGFIPEGVAKNWGSFINGGRNVEYGFYDDTWKLAQMSGGQHSQLIEINTTMFGEGDPYQQPDRYAGVCQTITGLTPGASYYLTVNGMLRVSEFEWTKSLTDWSHVADWGFVAGSNPDCNAWNQVNNWQVFPWQQVYYRESPGSFSNYQTVLWAQSDTITVYFRLWKKWAIGHREVLLSLDNLSFAGFKPVTSPTATAPVSPTATTTGTTTAIPATTTTVNTVTGVTQTVIITTTTIPAPGR
jgi:hypothetical protein